MFEGGDEARGGCVADGLQRAHERHQVARAVVRLEQRLVRVHRARHVLQQLRGSRFLMRRRRQIVRKSTRSPEVSQYEIQEVREEDAGGLLGGFGLCT